MFKAKQQHNKKSNQTTVYQGKENNYMNVFKSPQYNLNVNVING